MGGTREHFSNIFRWAFFIPLFFLIYYLSNRLLAMTLYPVFGPYDVQDWTSFTAYQLYLNVLSTGFAVMISSLFAPKFRGKIAKAYLVLIAIYFVMHFPFLLVGTLSIPVWQLLFSMVTMLAGGLWGVKVVNRKTMSGVGTGTSNH